MFNNLQIKLWKERHPYIFLKKILKHIFFFFKENITSQCRTRLIVEIKAVMRRVFGHAKFAELWRPACRHMGGREAGVGAGPCYLCSRGSRSRLPGRGGSSSVPPHSSSSPQATGQPRLGFKKRGARWMRYKSLLSLKRTVRAKLTCCFYPLRHVLRTQVCKKKPKQKQNWCPILDVSSSWPVWE